MTTEFDGGKMDLGAAWIHGQGPGSFDKPQWKGQLNPIYEIAKSSGFATAKTWEGDRDPHFQTLSWYRGGPVPYDIHKMLEEMEAYLSLLTSRKDPALDGKSVAEVLRKQFLNQRSSKIDK